MCVLSKIIIQGTLCVAYVKSLHKILRKALIGDAREQLILNTTIY